MVLARLAAAAAGVCAAAHAAAPRPNVLLLFADDLGYNQLNLAGQPIGYSGVDGAIQTPNMARFAKEGTTFMQWYSAFHVCTPSRSSLMTGRLPVRLGLGDGVLSLNAKGGLQPNETTLAEALGALGYETAMFGKWHLGQREQYLPHNRGFKNYFGIPFSCDMGCSPWHGPNPTSCGSNTPVPLLNGTTGAAAAVVEQPADLKTLTQRYADWGAAFVAAQSAAKTPWFLYAAFNHVHVTAANYSKAFPAPGYSPWQFSSKKFCGSSQRGGTGDAVVEMDDAVGQLMAAVKAAGVDDNTIAFFTSDNGNPEYGDMSGNLPLRGYKASNWEGGIREPALARWPGHVAAGATSWEVAATYDIFPTVLALAGGAPQPGRAYDGMDLSGVLLGGEPSPHKCVFHWHDSNMESGLTAVRCGDYKVHYKTQADYAGAASAPPGWAKSWPTGKHDPPLMFNLRKDPSESTPIESNSSEFADNLKVADAAKAAHLASIVPVCSQNKAPCGGRCSGSACPSYGYAVCGDPDSKQKYPQWPQCTSTPSVWEEGKPCV